MTQFMITTRRANNDKAVGPARYITFEDETGPEQDFKSAPRRWVAQLIATFRPQVPEGGGTAVRQGDILFLVHGFNVSHKSARAFHMDCVRRLADAGWTGQVVSYDWPSAGLVFAYLPDRDTARAAASALIQNCILELQRAQTDDCAINVHVMAHSMGCFVVQQAFNAAYQDVPTGWRVGQILMAAADVDYTVFAADNVSAKRFNQHAGRLTAYCNSYDKALAASNAKRLELAPRMGRVGLPDDAPRMMCEVDCTAFFETAYPDISDQFSPETSHCFYFKHDAFWQDVVLTLGGGIDRSLFPTRDATALDNRLALKPAGPDKAIYELALARAKTNTALQT